MATVVPNLQQLLLIFVRLDAEAGSLLSSSLGSGFRASLGFRVYSVTKKLTTNAQSQVLSTRPQRQLLRLGERLASWQAKRTALKLIVVGSFQHATLYPRALRVRFMNRILAIHRASQTRNYTRDQTIDARIRLELWGKVW